MERFLRPDRFEADPNSALAAKQWTHWKRTFTNFVASLEPHDPDKLNTLINFIGPSVYEYVADSDTYEKAIDVLETLYVKPRNEIFARHLLATLKQENGQSLDEFLQKLKSLARDCNFQPVTAEKNRDDSIRDAFISGLQSSEIRQRLLEKKTLDLQTAYDEARSLEMANAYSKSYNSSPSATFPCGASAVSPDDTEETLLAAAGSNSKCYFCGYSRHPRFRCPAKDAICKGCKKKGHFLKVCQSQTKNKSYSSALSLEKKPATSSSKPQLATVSSAFAPQGLTNAVAQVTVNGLLLSALVDTGSSESYINPNIPHQNNWSIIKSTNVINMASTKLMRSTEGHCKVTMNIKGKQYHDVQLSLLPDLCSDIILGHDFLRRHKGVHFSFQGSDPPLSLCGLTPANVVSPPLFLNLTEDCKPIATKSRRHTRADEVFIAEEIQKLLKDGIIEASQSPWRAQVLVTTNERQKRRLVMDYSQTINRYIQLDTYPLPKICAMVEEIARYSIYSTVDLQSVYHQILILEHEKKYTAFEACGQLYQFRRIPFGVTNGVVCFQRVMDSIIKDEKLQGTYAYVDNTVVSA